MQYVSYPFIVSMVKMKSNSKLTIWSLLSVRFVQMKPPENSTTGITIRHICSVISRRHITGFSSN